MVRVGFNEKIVFENLMYRTKSYGTYIGGRKLENSHVKWPLRSIVGVAN